MMADLVYNEVQLFGDPETVAKAVADMRSEESLIDFDKMMPVPKDLDIECRHDRGVSSILLALDKSELTALECCKGIEVFQSQNMCSVQEYLDYVKNINPEDYHLGRKYYSNFKKYGYKHRYDWCDHNWGTTQNAKDIKKISEGTYCFQTADLGVEKIFKEFSKKYLGLTICYFCDDVEYTIKDGEITASFERIVVL